MKTAHQITHEVEAALGGGDFEGKQCNRVTKVIAKAIADARAAGFAEALSLAAEEASKWADGFHIAKAIRALAPAKTP